MSIASLSDADLRSLVKWSDEFCDRAAAELERRARAREQRQDRDQDAALAGRVTQSFLSGRWD